MFVTRGCCYTRESLWHCHPGCILDNAFSCIWREAVYTTCRHAAASHFLSCYVDFPSWNLDTSKICRLNYIHVYKPLCTCSVVIGAESILRSHLCSTFSCLRRCVFTQPLPCNELNYLPKSWPVSPNIMKWCGRPFDYLLLSLAPPG